MSYFHFSIGPVQEFVSQARRTTDFWAGSFLLSWLSGVAMCAVRAQNPSNNIVFPLPPDDYLKWITGNPSPTQQGPMTRIGAIPNRFCAEVIAPFSGKQVADAVRCAWIALARHTLTEDKLTLDEPSQNVWERQIERMTAGLWDIQWVVVDEADVHAALDWRKNVRTHLPPAEPGQKCTLMQGWQELSGSPYQQVAAFWDRQRHRGMDIGENEHLSAPAWVKRRFVHHFWSFEAQIDPHLALRGWALQPGVPSTHYLAAVPWLCSVLQKAGNDSAIQCFEACAKASGVSRGESNTRLRRMDEAVDAFSRTSHRLPSLHTFDGIAFFQDEIINNRELRSTADLLASLQALQASTDCVPTKSYALLLMDGDSMGQHIEKSATSLAQALKQFIGGVDAIVQQCSGYLVYAGGDDVFALLPVDGALPCATQLRRFYLQCFALFPEIVQPSISAAVVFAHYKTPLTQVINDAHVLLDEVAKAQCGRDSLAVRVWKGSGQNLTWGRPWQRALRGDTDQLELVALASQLVDNPLLFTSGFFFRANAIYAATKGMLDVPTVKDLILFEYAHSLQAEGHAAGKPEIEAVVNPLFQQSLPCRRILDANGGCHFETWGDAEPEAAMLLRFLLQVRGLDVNGAPQQGIGTGDQESGAANE